MPRAEEWKSRSIYQILTDRFAVARGEDVNANVDVNEDGDGEIDISSRPYCGGTWTGVIEKLDYIQGMGFDAVWISPVTKNIEEDTFWGMAYHGYWQEDMYQVNMHFGTAADLKGLSDALHARGMYLMVDVVVNHMASTSEVDFTRYVPFNSASYYHPKNIIDDYTNQTLVEQGWLGDHKVPLPDLDTENPTVARTLHAWIATLVRTFSIDGLRLDTVKHVPKEFWPGFVRAAGVWCVGEVLSGDPDYLSEYQPFVGGLLDYATYYPLQRAFRREGGGMLEVAGLLSGEYRRKFADTQLLATFMECHDMPRWPRIVSGDGAAMENAVTWTVLTDGIPLIYYGMEQYFAGPPNMNTSDDQSAREVMWKSGYKITPLYRYISFLNRIRKLCWPVGFGSNLALPIHADVNTLAIRKGPLLMILSNQGSQSAPRKVSLHTTFPTGSILVNLLTGQSISVTNSNTITLVKGRPQMYLPYSLASQICEHVILPPQETNLAAKLFYRFFARTKVGDGRFWGNGVPVFREEILKESMVDVQGGEVLGPKRESLGSPYSIFQSWS